MIIDILQRYVHRHAQLIDKDSQVPGAIYRNCCSRPISTALIPSNEPR